MKYRRMAAIIIVGVLASAGGGTVTTCRPNGLMETLCTTDNGGRYSMHTHCRRTPDGTECKQNVWDNQAPLAEWSAEICHVLPNGEIMNERVHGRGQKSYDAFRKRQAAAEPACFDAIKRQQEKRNAAFAAQSRCLEELSQRDYAAWYDRATRDVICPPP